MGAQNTYLVTVLTKAVLISTSLNQIPVAMVPSHLFITIVIDSSPALCAPNKHIFVYFTKQEAITFQQHLCVHIYLPPTCIIKRVF